MSLVSSPNETAASYLIITGIERTRSPLYLSLVENAQTKVQWISIHLLTFVSALLKQCINCIKLIPVGSSSYIINVAEWKT
jgi:hypothetical protein